MSQTELAFLMRPVFGEMAPGMPTPTLQVAPSSTSTSWTSATTAATVCS